MLNHVPDQAEGLRRLIESTGTVETAERTELVVQEDPSVSSVTEVDATLEDPGIEADAVKELVEARVDLEPTEVAASVPAPVPSAVLTVTSRRSPYRPSRQGRDRLGIRSETKVIAVTSGKGGVGKTNLVCNLALALSQMGRRVVVFDADLSLANIDVLLGISPRYNLSHVIAGEKTLKEVLVTGPEGILIVPGGSGGVEELANLDERDLERLLESFEELDGKCDVLLIDTAAGINHIVLSFLLAADYVLVVTTPEPTAYTDAYAVIKILTQHVPDKPLAVAVNMARNSREAGEVIRLMLQICRTMLRVGFDNLGSIPQDLEVLQAVRDQRPLLLHSPYSPAAKSIRRLACSLLQTEGRMSSSGGLREFMTRLLGRVRAPHLLSRIVMNRQVC
jgi:flagellar biosynthesis protein FlhG